jgi:integrase
MSEFSKPVKNKSGYYEVRWNEWDAAKGRSRDRTYSLSTKDYAEAVRRRDEFLSVSNHVATATTNSTIGAMLDRYQADHVEANVVSPTNARNIKNKLRPFFGALDLADLLPAKVQEYTKMRKAQPYRGRYPGSSAIRRELNILVAALTHCFKVGRGAWPDQNIPVPYIPLPPGGEPRKAFLPAVTAQSVWELAYRLYMDRKMDAAPEGIDGRTNKLQDERIYLFVLIALTCAARAGAIEELTPERVMLEHGLIDFRNPDKVATKKRRSIMPIAARLRPVLAVALQRAKDRGIAANGPLLGHTGSTEKAWRIFAKRAGIAGIKRHDLRRTFATLATKNGVPLWEVARVLGDNLATVEKHYAQFQPDWLVNAVNHYDSTLSVPAVPGPHKSITFDEAARKAG